MKNRFEELLRNIITSCGMARACLCGNFRNCGQENAPEKIITKTSYEVRGGESFWRGNFRNRGQEKAPRKIVTKKIFAKFHSKKKKESVTCCEMKTVSVQKFSMSWVGKSASPIQKNVLHDVRTGKMRMIGEEIPSTMKKRLA